MPPVKPDPVVMARDLVISRFLHHMPAHSIATFSISPSLMAATTDPAAAAAFFRQHPRLALQAAAFAEARSVVAVPGLGLTLDPRLRWSIDRVNTVPQAASGSRAPSSAPAPRQDGFAPCPLSPGRDLADDFTKRLYRGKGVTRTKMAKLESALAAVRRGVEQAAVDCGAVRREELGAPMATPRWVQLATAAADAAMRPTDSFAIHGFQAGVLPVAASGAAEMMSPDPALSGAADAKQHPQDQPPSRVQVADELLAAWLQPMAAPSARPAAPARPASPAAGKHTPARGGKADPGSKWELETAAWTWGGDVPAPVPHKPAPTPKRKRASSGGWGIEHPRR